MITPKLSSKKQNDINLLTIKFPLEEGEMDLRELFSQSYIEFKSWGLNHPTEDDLERFSIETQHHLIQTPSKIFEVGFGQGHFLLWAKEKGHEAHGTEVIPKLANTAKEKGIAHALNIKIQDLTPEATGTQFDLITAFDVLEHLYPHEIFNFLLLASKILKPEGNIIIRVPNGQSPFGRFYQNGDITHVTELSGAKLKQLADKTGFEILSIQNSARPLGKSIKQKVLRKIIYLLRDLIGYFISKTFWGETIPMDPNITVTLRKSSNSIT